MGETAMHRQARKYVSGRIARREVKRVTGRRQLGVLAVFCDAYGDRDVKMLGRSHIEHWMETRGHLAVGTRRYEVSTMRQFVRWLQRERIIRGDPMIDVRTPKVPRSVPRALERAQTEAIWGVLPDARARAIFVLMRWLALRRCEVIALEIGDWDRGAQILRVRGKGDHVREVPVTAAAALALANYIDSGSFVAGPLIRRLDGTGGISNCYVGVLMKHWMEAAGVKQRAYDGKASHSLRHTALNEVATAEPDLRVTQELAGHVHLSSTEVYLKRAHLSQIRAAMEAATG